MTGNDEQGTEVLVVDDERGVREVLEITLRRQSMRPVCARGVGKALEIIAGREAPFPLVISDLVMPDGSGMQVLQAAKQRSAHTEVIMISAYSTVESAIDAMRQGAYDFLTKPFSPAEMAALAHKALEKSSLVAENRRLRARLASLLPGSELDPFGPHPKMRRIATLVQRAAATRSTVLLTGESGTGKEWAARILHQLSDRSGGPFCVINCGALPEALMESELFGHEKGAFTGATTAAAGIFRQAEGGTLLLDEIGELPVPLQVKLLRVLQERKVRPVGADTERDIDVRVLAATNREVEAEVEAGRFRKDLYYRLNVIRIELPPLRERRSDIPALARRMAARFGPELGREPIEITAAAMRALETYDFPGNIRELENVIERAAALASAEHIDVGDLPDVIVGGRPSSTIPTDLPTDGCALDEVLGRLERRLIDQALQRTDGARTAAAKLLGISFRSLRYRIGKLSETDGAERDGEHPAPAEPAEGD